MSDETEAALVAELVEAKDAYRADPTPANRAAKTEAAEAVRAHRAHARRVRTGNAVGGDAFISTDQNEG